MGVFIVRGRDWMGYFGLWWGWEGLERDIVQFAEGALAKPPQSLYNPTCSSFHCFNTVPLLTDVEKDGGL